MGQPKALLEIDGKPLVIRAVELLAPLCSAVTLVGTPERYQHLGHAVIADERPDIGPLGGILTALSATATDWNLIVACDLPYLTTEWLRYLIQRAARSTARVLLPESASGLEPLCAVYHRAAAAAIRDSIARGVLKVTMALQPLAIERVTPAEIHAFDPRGNLFQNLNTPGEFDRARDELEG